MTQFYLICIIFNKSLAFLNFGGISEARCSLDGASIDIWVWIEAIHAWTNQLCFGRWCYRLVWIRLDLSTDQGGIDLRKMAV